MKAKTLTTNQGRIFKITSNKSAKHFTIVTDTGNKWKTIPFTKCEFTNAQYWTGNDWQNFLKNTNDYFKV